jgi:RHS repeat-associated protein
VPEGSYALTAVATVDAGATANSAAVTVTVGAHVAQMYFIHPDHLNTPRSITDQSGNEVWRWDNTEPFGDSVPNGDPGNTGSVFDTPLGFAGQYRDRETGTFYNYFRDYDPLLGRYVQSDPIGLLGGINTYFYVRGHPLWAIDAFGLAEICRRQTEKEWKEIGRGWKIVDWKCETPCNPYSDAIFNAISALLPAVYIPVKIPVYRDLALEQAFNVDYKVCYDECTKKQTSKTKIGEEALKEYRENWYNPSTQYDGPPMPVPPGQDDPSMQTRWGRQYR